VSPRLGAPASVVCLLGKPPRAATIFPRLFDALRARGVRVRVELPHEAGLRPEEWPPDALVVHRGLRRPLLERLAEVEAAGWRCCNPARATLAVRDRPALMDGLARAGLPTPGWRVARTWDEARRLGDGAGVVVKAVDGGQGRGAGVLRAAAAGLPVDPPFGGPYLVERFVENDGRDRKLYVAGRACFGLLKPWPRDEEATAAPFAVEPALEALALATGVALGLEIYGVDALLGPEGPVIVDVNVFPSFKGVEGAAETIADHLARRAREAA
jgi:ribosomal protein S6--L-glutamate ligase